jgi:hypothetical protein
VLKLHPFELKLVSGEHVHPASRLQPKKMPPGVPSGPPPSSHPPGGSTGGFAPSQPSRATLKEVDGKLTWIVEHRYADGSWRVVLKEPIE